jgi:Asp-tRNA(Asn)/Glu-tRNA(Gln) amidotransferase C subunit
MKKQTVVKDIKINPQIRQLLERPTWSVASLLPPRATATKRPSAARNTNPSTKIQFQEDTQEITREKLRHLLKLSALPPPKDQAEEEEMLSTLRSQVHFVKEIQKVDTSGVEPLVAIRDETRDHIWASMVTAEKLEQFFVQEDRVGDNGTIRRQKDNSIVISGDSHVSPYSQIKRDAVEQPFLMARDNPAQGRRIGQYFYVKRRSKKLAQAQGLDTKKPADPA